MDTHNNDSKSSAEGIQRQESGDKMTVCQEWQPIETAPKDQAKIIAGAYIGRAWCVGVCWYSEHAGQWLVQTGNFPDKQPTHWMPLPPPPAGGPS